MGMISRFIDKLRNTAMQVEIFLEGSTDAIPTDTHEQLRNAADIIWELRNDLQRANYAVQNAEHDKSMAWDRVRKAEAENENLRELVRDMWRFTGTACKKYPRLFDPSAQGGQMVQLNMIDAFEQRMNELGVEVES